MRVLFWGRDGSYGPDYPRNRVVREAVVALGHEWAQFKPWLSALADVEAVLRDLAPPDLVWVPCFRQRDVLAGARWAHRRGLPLIFDPLISAWDKQVNERGKFSADSAAARRLLARERRQFAGADVVIADTDGHADYFGKTLLVPREKVVVVPVGAEESLFRPQPVPRRGAGELPELVFFGTFIGLHGLPTLLAAIDRYDGPPVRWRLLGDGPLRGECEARIARWRRERPSLDVAIEGWRPLAELPARLARADALLGIFGSSAKAGRVIPNKAYQALALGRPLLTARSEAWPADLAADESRGIFWCAPGDPDSLAEAVRRLMARLPDREDLAVSARNTYEQYFSARVVQQRVQLAIETAIASRR